MASSTLTCLQRIHWRFRSMKAAPDVRMRSAISSAGGVTGAPPPQRDPHLYQIRLAITAPLVKRSVRRRAATSKRRTRRCGIGTKPLVRFGDSPGVDRPSADKDDRSVHLIVAQLRESSII